MIVYIKLFKGAFDFFRVFLIGPDVRGFPIEKSCRRCVKNSRS